MNRIWIFLAAAVALQAQPYDLVLQGGRVLDPESGLDAIRNVGIRGGKVAAISEGALSGTRTIDAAGLVIAPGFIDLHAHGQDEENQRLQAHDGVTSALELEIGDGDIDAWYRAREGKRLIHSGVTVGHVPARMRVLKDPSPTLVPSGVGKDNPATDEEITRMKVIVERGLQQGALGVGFGVQYTPGASRWEILEMFRVAGRFGAPAFVHIRTMGGGAREALIGVQEVIADGIITGTPVHIVHVTSSSLRTAPQVLQTIAEAQARGLDVTTECYPYTAAMTDLASAIFDDGWQKVLGIDYGGVQWVATGERLTAETFARYRKQGGMVIMHMIPEEVARLAVSHKAVMIASDGLLQNGKGHPRGAGTFTRVLGRYVREQQALTLMDAVRKMALMPAQRLEKYVPAMRGKGRIRVGADADLVVFDAQRVSDRATFEQPALVSAGIAHLIVAGAPLIENGRMREGVYPGQAVRAAIRE